MFAKSVLIACLVWLAAFVQAAAEDFVVIAAPDSPGVPARGEVLGSDRSFALADGQEIAVIRQNGDIIRIAGPFDGRIGDHLAVSSGSEAESATLKAISDLLSDDKKLVATLGSARNTRAERNVPAAANLWKPFMIGTGTVCVDASRPVVRRQKTKNRIKLTLTSPELEFADFAWLPGQRELRLESSLIEPGKTYKVLMSDRSGESSIIARPADLGDNPAELIAWLSEAGCLRQAYRLVDQLARAAN